MFTLFFSFDFSCTRVFSCFDNFLQICNIKMNFLAIYELLAIVTVAL